ncbi:MAG: hypothetical protein WCB68_07965 [Pyrinomonadaceae bacterium]
MDEAGFTAEAQRIRRDKRRGLNDSQLLCAISARLLCVSAVNPA